jgi:hypothetical protein
MELRLAVGIACTQPQKRTVVAVEALVRQAKNKPGALVL